MKAAFGKVVDVKPAKSLGVTRIVLEIPVEFHKEATSLFFDQHALLTVADASLAPGYGILDSGAGVTINAAKLPADISEIGSMVSGPIIHAPAKHPIASRASFAAVMLKDPLFIDFLRDYYNVYVTSAEDAEDAVKTTLKIERKRDLNEDDAAWMEFRERFALPFSLWKDRQNGPAK